MEEKVKVSLLTRGPAGMIGRVDRREVKDVEMPDKQNRDLRLDLQTDRVKRKASPVRRLSLEVQEKVK